MWRHGGLHVVSLRHQDLLQGHWLGLDLIHCLPWRKVVHCLLLHLQLLLLLLSLMQLDLPLMVLHLLVWHSLARYGRMRPGVLRCRNLKLALHRPESRRRRVARCPGWELGVLQQLRRPRLHAQTPLSCHLPLPMLVLILLDQALLLLVHVRRGRIEDMARVLFLQETATRRWMLYVGDGRRVWGLWHQHQRGIISWRGDPALTIPPRISGCISLPDT